MNLPAFRESVISLQNLVEDVAATILMTQEFCRERGPEIVQNRRYWVGIQDWDSVARRFYAPVVDFTRLA